MRSSKLTFSRFFSIFLVFLLASIMIACGKKDETLDDKQEIIIPTDTPIISTAPDRAILVSPGDPTSIEFIEAQALVNELASGSGLEFEIREEIFASEITADVRIIIFLEQPDNLGSLAAGAAGTQFVAISDQDWSPPANGTIIRKNKDHVAFISGYLSALVAPNFRAGGLLLAEEPGFNQAFANGVSYFCGICAAVVYPLNTYPVIAQQPTASPPANWQAAFNEININKVNVLFLPGEAASAEMGAFLAGMDVAVIGNQPPTEEIKSRWVATISSDGLTPLRNIWSDLLDGNGGKVLNANVKLSDLNYVSLADGLVWLSQGKIDHLSKVIDLLREGQINPYSVTP